MPASLPAPAVVEVVAPVTPVAAPQPPPPPPTSVAAAAPMFGHLKAFQSALLSTVRFEPPVKKESDGDDLTSLRLSTMINDDDSEEIKALEREQKLSKLNDEQMMRFHIKKKQFETAFRNDCETYAVVTRALLSKDETLQFGLKMSLLENMEDLYKKMMKRVDDQLDALLAA
ncbi:hypothetical protein CRE_01452 [Caenorhabditis remanei]|uniref:Periphilin-1 C-terminal domain-containing protein n=1 Tax=Caenorhabditis remanei TaxID=31234 RepID=E3NNF5_CAERE|nr:hypothetical protein CRE_01452 [Caenorhabditis remanei]